MPRWVLLLVLVIACDRPAGLGFDPRDPSTALAGQDLVEFCQRQDRATCGLFQRCHIGPQPPCVPMIDNDPGCPLASCEASPR